MRFKTLISLVTLISFLQIGCYKTYNLNLDELKKVQESDGATFKALNTEDGQSLTVTENSRVGVIDKKNIYYPISPFNFTISDRQLVAPDEDLLLMRSQIKAANIKLIDPTNTIILVTSTLAVLVGAAIAITLSGDECQGDFCQTP